MIAELLRVAGVLLAAIVGGLVVHVATRRRDLENERRRQRLDYLISAYRTLARSAHRGLSGKWAEAFEDALSDVVMLGNDEQIKLARETINALALHREAPMDALLISLRNALRRELSLPGDILQHVPVVRIMSGNEEYHRPLRLDGAKEVTFAQEMARTSVALASASTDSSGHRTPEESESATVSFAELNRDLQKLRDLAHAAPDAAVVTGYGHVATALASMLLEDGIQDLNQYDASVLARMAADRGLITDQLVETVQGLAVLKDLGVREGAGTGLSIEQANEYIALVGAALYVLSSRRAKTCSTPA